MTYNANERDSQKWFSLAIAAGHMSTNQSDKHYSGNYSFMGAREGMVYFKHSLTGEYHNVEADKLIKTKSTKQLFKNLAERK